ncbi:4-hydroxyphenylacetate isomerase [Marinomonas piezotolerans]|uniref:4-hydroxyphenylacetate isomerase n=1 Tax=Marinomonas piezotolerans TaxID=2213058 RepID=A0A370UCX6_9GAMM|nr:fumarylacetoacetate hydrolase family protein [Marinomonas piezotolerans]RDL45545.1 4-hydroxyphenylacetate isomerase [Marinomonas piezotolerans]
MYTYRLQESGKVVTKKSDTTFAVDMAEPLAPATHGAVIGVALNNKDLVASIEDQFEEKPYVTPPKTPVLHIKTDNTHIGHGQTIRIPTNKGAVYAGPSLGIVIGKKATRVSEEHALDFVKGYTVVNEVSLAETSFYRPAVKAKCRDTFCPIGPWVVDKALVTNPNSLSINTYVNDELVHSTSTDCLVHSVEKIISYISSFMTLEVGDLIIAGTPLRDESLEIKGDDIVMIDIEAVGRLANPVEQE